MLWRTIPVDSQCLVPKPVGVRTVPATPLANIARLAPTQNRLQHDRVRQVLQVSDLAHYHSPLLPDFALYSRIHVENRLDGTS